MTYKELEHTYRETSPEQFTSFIHAVKKARNAGELNSFEISTALCHIADSEIDECRRIGMKGMAMDKNERLRLIMSAKMLACSLVLLCESRSRNEARTRSLLFLEYTSYLNSYKCKIFTFNGFRHGLVAPFHSLFVEFPCQAQDIDRQRISPYILQNA